MGERVGDRLRRLRERANLKPVDCERLAGLTSGHVWQIEQGAGRARVRGETAVKLARLFGASVEYILLGSGEPPSDWKLDQSVRAAKRSVGSNDSAPDSPRGAA